MMSYVPKSIPVYYDEKFYGQTGYERIDPEYHKMFKVMKAYKFKGGSKVVWILAKKSLTLKNIKFLEREGWQIVGVEAECDEIKLCKQDLGDDNVHIKLTIKKEIK